VKTHAGAPQQGQQAWDTRLWWILRPAASISVSALYELCDRWSFLCLALSLLPAGEVLGGMGGRSRVGEGSDHPSLSCFFLLSTGILCSWRCSRCAAACCIAACGGDSGLGALELF